MKLLVGNTGLIGTTLKTGLKFDYEFNSSNIDEILKLDTTNSDLFLSCLPATKWLVNKNPQKDFENMMSIVKILSNKQFRTIILYSTIDVYQEVPIGSNEETIPPIYDLNYGSIRYMFELFIRQLVKHQHLVIIRLPALFGKNIKKNIIYDLIHSNQVEKIKYNSSYQWYNLENLVQDTHKCAETLQQYKCFNLFTEPIPTADILNILDIKSYEVDNTPNASVYNFKTKHTATGYVDNKQNILSTLTEFILEHKLKEIKIAVCIFGERRDLLKRLQSWQNFSKKFQVDFYIALYSDNEIYESIKLIKDTINVKGIYIADNDLDKFDSLKHKADHPVYIYGTDPKALFSRITSQLYIRQKVVSLVDNEYDAIMLCRSDISKFNITKSDVRKVIKDKNLLIVNSGNHTHPGGGGGCVKCCEVKCSEEYHHNDICDYWHMGSYQLIKSGSNIYDNALNWYRLIQKNSKALSDVKDLTIKEHKNHNEIIIHVPINNLNLIENDIHCYYPEKILRVAYRNARIIDATHNTDIWN